MTQVLDQTPAPDLFSACRAMFLCRSHILRCNPCLLSVDVSLITFICDTEAALLSGDEGDDGVSTPSTHGSEKDLLKAASQKGAAETSRADLRQRGGPSQSNEPKRL